MDTLLIILVFLMLRSFENDKIKVSDEEVAVQGNIRLLMQVALWNEKEDHEIMQKKESWNRKTKKAKGTKVSFRSNDSKLRKYCSKGWSLDCMLQDHEIYKMKKRANYDGFSPIRGSSYWNNAQKVGEKLETIFLEVIEEFYFLIYLCFPWLILKRFKSLGVMGSVSIYLLLIYAIRVDAFAEFEKTLAITDDIFGFSISYAPDGTYCVVGFALTNPLKGIIFKANTFGNHVWTNAKTCMSTICYSVLATESSGCVIAGRQNRLCTDSGRYVPFVYKLSTDGAVEFNIEFTQDSAFEAYKIFKMVDGNYLVSGHVFVAKVNEISGNVMLFRPMGVNPIQDAVELPNGRIAAIGHQPASGSANSCFLTVLNPDLTNNGSGSFNHTYAEYCYGLTVADTDNVYVTGYQISDVSPNPVFTYIILKKFDVTTGGSVNWQNAIAGSDSNNNAHNLVKLGDGRIAIIGSATKTYGTNLMRLIIANSDGFFITEYIYTSSTDGYGISLAGGSAVAIVGRILVPAGVHAFYIVAKNLMNCNSGYIYVAYYNECYVSCSSPNYLIAISNSCGNCPEDKVYDTTRCNCYPCNTGSYFIRTTKTCDPCTGMFYLGISKSCGSCSRPDVYYTGNYSCEACWAGFYYLASLSKCGKCYLTQTYNSGDFTCVNCGPGEYNEPGQNHCRNCSLRTYLDLTSSPYCKNCGLDCLRCTNANYCTTCDVGMFINRTSTVKHNCVTTCGTRLYGNTTTLFCEDCLPYCLTCLSWNKCQICDATYFHFPNYLLGQDACLNSCPAGYYANSSKICVQCDFRCAVCTDGSPNSCASCNPMKAYVLQLDPLTCGCENGYKANMERQECEKVVCDDPVCTECLAYEPSKCLSCSIMVSGLKFNPNTSKCYCEPGTYRDGNVCRNCHKLCSECSGPESSNCLSYKCSEGSYPKKIKTTTCVYMCDEPGTFLRLNYFSKLCEILICHDDCYECIGPLKTNCIICKNPAFVQLAGSCVDHCPSDYYVNRGICYNCNPECSKCEDSSGCIECRKPLLFYNKKCFRTCPEGTFNSASFLCSECSANCITCSSLTMCTACSNGFFLYNGTCMGIDMLPEKMYAFVKDEIREFRNCSLACVTCSGPFNSDCGTCDSAAGFVTISRGVCRSPACNIGYFTPKIITKSEGICQKCNESCATCNDGGPTDCILCNLGYINVTTKNGSICKTCEEFKPGYKIDPISMSKCIEICGDGKNLGEVECDDGNTRNRDGCSEFCMIEPSFDCIKQLNAPDYCFTIIPPEPKLIVLDNNTAAFITFSRPIYYNSTKYKKLKPLLTVDITNRPSGCNFNWSCNSSSSKTIELFTRIDFTMFINCSITGVVEKMAVTFNKPWLFSDENNITLRESSISTDLSKTRWASLSEKSLVESAGASFTSANFIILGVSFARYLFQSVALGSFWSLINMLQMMFYTSIACIYIPSNLQTFLANYLSIAQLQLPVPNILPKEFLSKLNPRIGVNLNNLGLKSVSFIYNFYGQLATWLILGISYVVLCFLDLILPEDKFLFIRRWKKDYVYNNVIRTLIESFMDLSFYSILNLRFFNMDSNYLIFSYVTSIIATALALIFFACCMSLTSLMESDYDDEFNDECSALTEEFKESQGPLCRGYYCIFLLKRFAYSIALVYGIGYPMSQIACLTGLDFAMLSYLLLYRPYKTAFDNYVNNFNECGLFIVHIMLFYIKVKSIEETERSSNLGWASVAIIMLCVLQVWITTMAPILMYLFRIVKQFVCHKSPGNSSDRISIESKKRIEDINSISVEENIATPKKEVQKKKEKKESKDKDKDKDKNNNNSNSKQKKQKKQKKESKKSSKKQKRSNTQIIEDENKNSNAKEQPTQNRVVTFENEQIRIESVSAPNINEEKSQIPPVTQDSHINVHSHDEVAVTELVVEKSSPPKKEA